MKYARLNDAGVVLEVFVAPVVDGQPLALSKVFPPSVAQGFETVPSGVELGWTRTDGEWSAPAATPPAPAPAPAPAARHITKLAFRNRVTTQEKTGLELAAVDVPDGTGDQRLLAAMLRSLLRDLDAATYVDLDWAYVRDGLEALEQAGLLAAGRAEEILSAEVQSSERWNA